MGLNKLSWILGLTIAVATISYSACASAPTDMLRFFNEQGPRIINGTEATLKATKHQVSVRSRYKDDIFYGTGHLCGASLISENVVLSAGHCFIE
ncbi:lectizyme-like [Stomoxys calcitrans]|uniref:lectizyme-like n=1 Tax=Stomoxys calcitrans TaxID=35570 RepID=UPI0027E38F54|nr:lectizyme-like [Stomoxys calcitrans]